MTLEEVYAQLGLDTGAHILALDLPRMLQGKLKARERAFTASLAAAAERAPTSVAIVPLFGGLYPGKMADFRGRLAGAVANADVGAIVIAIDSPGGTVAGTPETAAAVAAAQAVKPVTAHVDTLGASAAYWIASQAGKISLNPSADVGSIGVLAVHHDLSKMLEDAGVKATIMRSTPYKAEGNSLEPLGEEARASLQGRIDEAHAEFVAAVASGRKVSRATVESNFGQGRVIGAKAAVDRGMADRIATLGEVLSAARGKMSAMKRRSAFAFV